MYCHRYIAHHRTTYEHRNLTHRVELLAIYDPLALSVEKYDVGSVANVDATLNAEYLARVDAHNLYKVLKAYYTSLYKMCVEGCKCSLKTYNTHGAILQTS